MNEKRKIELDDDQLDKVSGGGEITATVSGRVYKTKCDNATCKYCGMSPNSVDRDGHYCKALGGESNFDSWIDYTCNNCAYLPNCQNYTGLGSPTPPTP